MRFYRKEFVYSAVMEQSRMEGENDHIKCFKIKLLLVVAHQNFEYEVHFQMTIAFFMKQNG